MEEDKEITVKGIKESIVGGEYNYEKTYKVGEYAVVVELGNTHNGRFGQILSISHEDETVEIQFTNGEIIKGISAHSLVRCGAPLKKRTKNEILMDTRGLLDELEKI